MECLKTEPSSYDYNFLNNKGLWSKGKNVFYIRVKYYYEFALFSNLSNHSFFIFSLSSGLKL